MARRQDYKKITDLFVRGTVILPAADSPPVWIQKLNAFEVEEVRTHASAARALVVEALRNKKGDSHLALCNAANGMDRDQLIEAVIVAAYGRHMAETANAIVADPEWQEKQSVLDRIDPAEVVDEEQQQALAAFNTEYFARLRDGLQERDDALRVELGYCDDEALRAKYIDAYIDSRGAAVFSKEQRVIEIAIGARMCDAKPDDAGSFDYTDAHDGCTHEPLFVTEAVKDDIGQPVLNADGTPRISSAIQQVRALPDELFGVYTAAFDRLNVPRSLAKGSASQQSSSALSRPQSEPEDSAVSTPTAPSTTPDGT